MGNPAAFTVTARSRHPDVDEDYDADRHRYRDSYVDPARVSYTLDLDAFPGSEVVDVVIVTGPKGKPHAVEVERLDLPDDAVSYEWRIDQRDGPFEEAVSTPIEQSTVGGTTGVFGTPYRLTQEVPEPGVYDVELQVRLESGGGPTTRQTVELRDFLVVSIGDSYASGEGNPDRPGEPAGFDLDAEWWEVVAVPILAFELTAAAFEWGRDLLTREFTTISQAADADIDMDPAPRWLEAEAHRSLRAGPAVAAGLVEDVRAGDLVTFVSFARSGAEVGNGLFGPRVDDDGDSIDGWIGHEGELDELRDLAARIGDRPIDALVVSIGGNDAGFSGRLTDMVKEDNPFLALSLGDDDASRATAEAKVDAALEALEGTASEPGALDRLAAALDDLDVRQVYVTEYPTAHFERTDGDRVRVEAGCGIFSSWFDADIDRADAKLMKAAAERLNGVLRRKAGELGWVYVGGVADGFRGHGYCMGDESFFVGAEGSLVKQGDTKGTLHPTAEGHQVYAGAIAEALRKHTIEDRPPAGAAVSVRRAASGHDGSDDGTISVRTLLDRVSPSPPGSVRALLRRL